MTISFTRERQVPQPLGSAGAFVAQLAPAARRESKKSCHSESAFGAPGRETGVPDTRPSVRAHARALKRSRVCRGGEAPRQENVSADVPLSGGRGIPLRLSPARGDSRMCSFRTQRFVAQLAPAALGQTMKGCHSESAFGAAVGADVPLSGGRGIPLRFTPARGDSHVRSFRAFVAQVVPAVLDARVPSLKHAGRPEAFSRVAQPLPAVHRTVPQNQHRQECRCDSKSTMS